MRTSALISLLGFAAVRGQGDAPFGVHIAYGAPDGSTSITVMWSTRSYVPTSVVSLLSPVAANVTGSTFPFSDSNNVQTMHRVYLTGLAPATRYTYTVGAPGASSSAPFSFTTQPADGGAWQPTLAIFGDMGISANAQATMPLLLADAASGKIDAVVHVGDAAYDLNANNGQTGGGSGQRRPGAHTAPNPPTHTHTRPNSQP